MSKITSITAPSALLAALTLVSLPAVAQERERYHGRQNPSGQESSGQSRERAQPRSEAPRARAEAQRPQAGAAPTVETRQQAPRAQAPAAPQQVQPQQVQPQQAQPQRQAAQPRGENRGNTDNRANTNRGYGSRQNDNVRGETGRAVPQGRAYAPQGRAYAPHYENHSAPHYAPRAYAPRGYGYYGSHTYYRPYVYRPHFSIGFGIYAGYPVPYTYSYAYPIAVYGYRAPRERVIVAPGSPYYGGIALEISPYDADVFVDGQYAGRVEDFDGTTQPLTLTAGMHELEVQAQGYEPLRVNVEIQPGQVIPYRGDLRAYER